jgi:hypothetical protein
MTSHLNLEQADEGSWRRKVIFRPGNCHTSGWRLEERGLRRSAYRVRPIRKILVVMSQWAKTPWNLEGPEAAPVWLVAMAAQPAKQEEAG